MYETAQQERTYRAALCLPPKKTAWVQPLAEGSEYGTKCIVPFFFLLGFLAFSI